MQVHFPVPAFTQLEPLPHAMPHELQCAFEPFDTHPELPQQYLSVPQLVPLATVREQLPVSVTVVPLHAPVAHAYVVLVRDRVPVVSHALA